MANLAEKPVSELSDPGKWTETIQIRLRTGYDDPPIPPPLIQLEKGRPFRIEVIESEPYPEENRSRVPTRIIYHPSQSQSSPGLVNRVLISRASCSCLRQRTLS